MNYFEQELMRQLPHIARRMIQYHDYLWPQYVWSTAGQYTRLVERFWEYCILEGLPFCIDYVDLWLKSLELHYSTIHSYRLAIQMFFIWNKPTELMVWLAVLKTLTRFPTELVCEFCAYEMRYDESHTLWTENQEVVCQMCYLQYLIVVCDCGQHMEFSGVKELLYVFACGCGKIRTISRDVVEHWDPSEPITIDRSIVISTE